MRFIQILCRRLEYDKNKKGDDIWDWLFSQSKS